MQENENSKSVASIKGMLSHGCMLTLIEHTDIMQNIYITPPHKSFMTYLRTCKQKGPLGDELQ